MITLNINDSGTIVPLSFPETLSELSFSKKVDFDVEVAKIENYLKSVNNDIYKNFNHYLYLVCNAIKVINSEFDLFECDITDLLESDLTTPKLHVITNHLHQIKIMHEVHRQSTKTEKTYLKYKAQKDLSILSVYEYLYNLIYLYVPSLIDTNKFSFSYKDTTWTISTQNNRKISVREGVEVLNSKLYSSIKQDKQKDSLLQIGNIVFSEYIRVLAILAKSEKFTIPIDLEEYKTYIDKQMNYFKDIDAKTCIDVSFFLIISMQN